MNSEPNQSIISEKPSTQMELETSETGLQSFSKMDLQLYLHFQRMLGKSEKHYLEKSNFFGKKLSKQENTNEKIKYLNYFEENIKPLPPQHHQQLLLLIDIFNNNNDLITNWYHIDPTYKDSTGPAKFNLSFDRIKQRIDLKQFLSFNWNHLVALQIYYCEWFSNGDWRALVENADNFKNLKQLKLGDNNISQIKEGDIEQFKSLEIIFLYFNPLSGESKEVLRRLEQKNKKMTILI